MSLSSHLNYSSSPVNQFIREQFPNTKTAPFLVDARKQLRAAETIRPPDADDLPWPTIGTAIDYRIRYYFDVTPIESLIAYMGARLITDDPRADGARKITDEQWGDTDSLILDFHWRGKEDDPISIFHKGTGTLLRTYHPATRGTSDMIPFRGPLSPDLIVRTGETRRLKRERQAAFERESKAFYKRLAVFTEMLDDFTDQVLNEGVASSPDNRPLKDEYKDFFKSLENFPSQCEPRSRRLTAAEEDILNRHCIVLALLEQVFRAGISACRRSSSPLFNIKTIEGEPIYLPRSTEEDAFQDANDLLSLAEPSWLDDMRQLSWRFYDGFSPLLELPHTLNPTFDGSKDVGGADADLIVDGTLIDIKTSIRPQITVKFIRELLGYTLLDYSDRYHIDSIGLYMSRQGILFKWSLDEVIADLCPGPPPSIAELRAKFQELMDAPWQSLMLRQELSHLLPY